MESLIIIIIFAVIASMFNSMQKNSNTRWQAKPFDYTKSLSRGQTLRNQGFEGKQNGNRMELPFEPYISNEMGTSSEGQNAPLSDEIAFGILNFNSQEGKQTEGEKTTLSEGAGQDNDTVIANDTVVREEDILDVDAIDFQRAVILSEILGPPKALKLINK